MSHHLSARIAGLLAVLMLSGCAFPAAGPADPPQPDEAAAEQDVVVYSIGEDVRPVEDEPSAQQPVQNPEPEPEQVTAAPAAYDFSQPVP